MLVEILCKFIFKVKMDVLAYHSPVAQTGDDSDEEVLHPPPPSHSLVLSNKQILHPPDR